MNVKQRLKDEIKALLLATLYFGAWVGMLMSIKTLILEEYQIAFNGWALAAVGVLVLAKVVLVLEHVSLGTWVRNRPAWSEVLLRTSLYTMGVFVVIVLEKAFEGRHEYGGFGKALSEGFQHADGPHIWANTICVTVALLGYNILVVIRRHLGAGGLLKFFKLPLPEETKTGPAVNGSSRATQTRAEIR